jgi:hypothetical protein
VLVEDDVPVGAAGNCANDAADVDPPDELRTEDNVGTLVGVIAAALLFIDTLETPT